MHDLPALVWRVPFTSPERALAGSADIAEEAGGHRAFAMCASASAKVVRLPRVPGWEANYEAFDDRAEAINAITERLVTEFGSVGCGGPRAEETAQP